MYGLEHGRLNSRRLPRLLLPGLYTLYNPLPSNVRTWIWWNITVMILLHYMAERILQIQFRSLISWLWVHFKREFTLGGRNFIQWALKRGQRDTSVRETHLLAWKVQTARMCRKQAWPKGIKRSRTPVLQPQGASGILPTIWTSLEEDSKLPIRKQPDQHLDFSLGRLNREAR